MFPRRVVPAVPDEELVLRAVSRVGEERNHSTQVDVRPYLHPLLEGEASDGDRPSCDAAGREVIEGAEDCVTGLVDEGRAGGFQEGETRQEERDQQREQRMNAAGIQQPLTP